ncbi:hypothetical protein Ciccas_004765 [Cichlidogyrus casuarinus]|uniref:Uncharacterized protein n=1 Tax=Cichlidogyrus casuarinus TaxID=1844966 RepID=A0ABD2QAK8_9PLAT
MEELKNLMEHGQVDNITIAPRKDSNEAIIHLHDAVRVHGVVTKIVSMFPISENFELSVRDYESFLGISSSEAIKINQAH